MKKMISKLAALVVALMACTSLTSCNYNSLVEMEQTVEQSWAQVENQYQRRLDLIPNLVNVVKGYADHESQTLQSVTNARAGLTQAYNQAQALPGDQAMASEEALQQYQQAQNNLKGALGIYVNAVREAYPDLKAN